MKKIAILICLFINAGCFAQSHWINIDSIPYDPQIIVSLAGKDSTLKEADIYIPFTLQARDTTIKILQFCVGFFCEFGDHAGWQEKCFTGNKACIDSTWHKMWYETSLGGGRLLFDRIVVEKNGRKCSVTGLIIPVQMRARTLKELRNYRNGDNGFS